MIKLSKAVAAQYPLVHMMLSPAKPVLIGDRKVIGSFSCRLIKADGVHALICDSAACTVHLMPLASVLKLSPQNDDNFTCRLDPSTRSIVVTTRATRESSSTGPIRAPRDSSVNLQEIAKNLGLDYAALAAKLTVPTTPAPTRQLVSTAELKESNTVHTMDELWKSAMDVDHNLPSLADLDLKTESFDALVDEALGQASDTPPPEPNKETG